MACDMAYVKSRQRETQARQDQAKEVVTEDEQPGGDAPAAESSAPLPSRS